MAEAPDQMSTLVDTIYSLTVDIDDYDDFMSSWDEVSEPWIASQIAQTAAASDREQQAMLAHFRRAQQIFDRIGRDHANPDDVQAIVASKHHPAAAIDREGRIVATNPQLLALIRDVTEGARFARVLEHSADHIGSGEFLQV